MSEYTNHVNLEGNGHAGFGVQLQPVGSDVFGHFGIGVTLATNFLLVVLDINGSPVDANLGYTLSYYNPASGQTDVLTLLHNPSIPYQGTLPENQLITFTLGSGSRYLLSSTPSITIGTNTFGVLRVQLAYPPGTVYACLIRKRFQ